MTDSHTIKGDEKLFIRRLFDLSKGAQLSRTPRYSFFLNEKEQYIAASQTNKFQTKLSFYGGYQDAVRKVLKFSPSGSDLEEDDGDFPMDAVRIICEKSTTLSHRDVLGSLIGLGLGRETIGDILPSCGECVVFVYQTVSPVILEELRSIGRQGISCSLTDGSSLQFAQQFEKHTKTVSSIRLDSLVGNLTGVSREKAAGFIRAQQVQQNYQVQVSTSAKFQAGDIFSIRGYGKYKIEDIGAPTKKGRLPITFKRYI